VFTHLHTQFDVLLAQNVHDIVQEAIENARFVCEEHYAMFKGPPVQLICPKNLIFPYVPGHLSHICFELLKNSLRAVVERYGPDREDDGDGFAYPPIKVVVVEGKEDITIKISDEGGGIARSAIPLIWTYMYTTMESQGIGNDFQASDFKAPMAGFGYGLPLSRLVSDFLPFLICDFGYLLLIHCSCDSFVLVFSFYLTGYLHALISLISFVSFNTTYLSVYPSFSVCSILRWRPPPYIYGWIWNRRVYPPEQTVKQS